MSEEKEIEYLNGCGGADMFEFIDLNSPIELEEKEMSEIKNNSTMKISTITKKKLEYYKKREGCKTFSDAVNLLLKVDELTRRLENE